MSRVVALEVNTRLACPEPEDVGGAPAPYQRMSAWPLPSKSPIIGVIPVGTAAASAAVAAPSATAVRRCGSWAAVGDATARASRQRQVSSRLSLAGRDRT